MACLLATFSCLFSWTASLPKDAAPAEHGYEHCWFAAFARHQVLAEVIGYLAVDDLENLESANFLLSEKSLENDCQEFRNIYQQKFLLNLNDGSRLSFIETLRQQRVEDIATFDDLGFVTDYLLKALEFRDYAIQDIIAAAKKNGEPYSIKLLMKVAAAKVSKFAASKGSVIAPANRPALTRHSYAILYTSYAVWHAVWNAAWIASRNAAWDAAMTSAMTAITNAAADAAVDAAWNAAWHAARNAAWQAAWSAAETTARAAASRGVGQMAKGEKRDLELVGRVSYSCAEGAAITYVLEHFDTVLSGVYQAAMGKLDSRRSSGGAIFSSQQAWQSFQRRHFAELLENPDQAIYVLPWLDAIEMGAAALWTAADD